MTAEDVLVAVPPLNSSTVPAEPSAVLNRVPAVTTAFWAAKVLTTGIGETTSDFFVKAFPPELVVPLAFVLLVAILVLQFRLRRYLPAVYWGAALAVSIFGTIAADVLHVGVGIPYAVSTVVFAGVLAAIFITWHRVEHTLSVHSITTRRREVFYWAAVLTTFALGTAVGDWTAASLGLGYLPSGVLFAAVITIPAFGYAVFRSRAVLAFWFAYVVTRPLGASFADWLGQPTARSGAGLGLGWVSLCGFALLAVLVLWLQASHRDTELAPEPALPRRPNARARRSAGGLSPD